MTRCVEGHGERRSAWACGRAEKKYLVRFGSLCPRIGPIHSKNIFIANWYAATLPGRH